MKYTKIYFSLLVLIVIGLFVYAGRADAALTKQLSYQGRLQDASGAPVANGTYSVTFSIYNVSTGGSALYTESQNVTVDKGGFSAYIGSVTPLNLPFNEDYFLGLTVGSDPEMTPRLKLSVVGTAVFAMDAANLGGQPSGNFALTSHTHTLSVGSTEIIDGSVNAGDIDATTVQRRVTGTCAGQVLVAINQDGTVTCEADDTGGGGGTPAVSVTSVGASAVVGTSTNYAREDHVHNVPAGLITDAEISATANIAPTKIKTQGLDADMVDGFHASATPVPNALLPLDGAGKFPKSALPLITGAEIATNSIAFSNISDNGCGSGQIMKYNGAAWACAADDVGGGGSVVLAPASAQTLQGTAGSFTPLIVKGAAGQSAPIFEVQNDAGTRLAAVMSDGHLIVDTVLHLVNVDNNSPSGPLGNVTIDVINNLADSKLIVTNSDPSFKAGLDVEGNLLLGMGIQKIAPTMAIDLSDAGLSALNIINTNSGSVELRVASQRVLTGVDGVVKSPVAAQTIQPTADATALVLKPGTAAPTVDIFGINNFSDVNLLKVSPAGNLLVGNPSNTTAKVSVEDAGTSNWAGYFRLTNNTSPREAVYGITSGTGAAVKGYTDGTGYAGLFEIGNASNSNPALFGTTSGTGRAGNFTINNVSNAASMIFGNTTGTGFLLQLQKGGLNKFVVDNFGNIATVNGGVNAVPLTDGVTQKLIQSGVLVGISNCAPGPGSTLITFPVAFLAAPVVTITPAGPNVASTSGPWWIESIFATSFTLKCSNGAPTSVDFHWMAIGNK